MLDVFTVLAGLALIAHIYTIIRTGREKRAAQPSGELRQAPLRLAICGKE